MSFSSSQSLSLSESSFRFESSQSRSQPRDRKSRSGVDVLPPREARTGTIDRLIGILGDLARMIRFDYGERG